MEKEMIKVSMRTNVGIPVAIINMTTPSGIMKVKRYGSLDYIYNNPSLYKDAMIHGINDDITKYACKQLPDPVMCKAVAETTVIEIGGGNIFPSPSGSLKGSFYIKYFNMNDDQYMLECPIIHNESTNNLVVEWNGTYAIYKFTDPLELPELITKGKFDLECDMMDDGASC